MSKMDNFLLENHQGDPNLNVLDIPKQGRIVVMLSLISHDEATL